MPTDSTTEDLLMRWAADGSRSVSELTEEVSKETGRSVDAIAKVLIHLKDEKRLIIAERSPYVSLSGYAFSPLSVWFWAALASTILTPILAGVSSGPLLFLRYLFGGALILFLPGFSMVQLIYAKREELDELTRLALSVGLSLAITPLVGLMLNYTPFGIRLFPVEVSLSCVSIGLLLLGLRRRHDYYRLTKGVV